MNKLMTLLQSIARRSCRQILALCAIMSMAAGCATSGPKPPPESVLDLPGAGRQSIAPPVAQQETLFATYASFGQLRTVIRSSERVKNQAGQEVTVSEITPLLERELVLRNFRLFNQVMAAPTDLTEITRRTYAHLVIDLDARSEFVNSTGQFSKYRALADLRAVRPLDGTIVSSGRMEQMGPRAQDPNRAGLLALRQLAEPVTKQLVQDLADKSGQLRWFGLSINPVANHNQAVQIRQTLAQQPNIEYVELLGWDRQTQTANYEVIHGLKHESDIPVLLSQIPYLRPRPTGTDDGQMRIFRNRLTHYK
jgi:hypothetical protein